ncbi:hypothetical protein EYF80_029050 [Liparis tanakae]|uniref:Uncharacterized protein n=1 Tax=Liparis tanakae TaxID=230148 RepID=A0A4Z2H4J7_9TELE|nr:hypothetical protein EYF80_029050 [Liparis tanakae]
MESKGTIPPGPDGDIENTESTRAVIAQRWSNGCLGKRENHGVPSVALNWVYLFIHSSRPPSQHPEPPHSHPPSPPTSKAINLPQYRGKGKYLEKD